MPPVLLFVGLGALVLLAAAGSNRSAGPAAPAVPGPLPGPPGCQGTWKTPQYKTIPQSVRDRAVALLHSGAAIGTHTVETFEGQVWRFSVETHGPSAQIPTPHRGVSVALCS